MGRTIRTASGDMQLLRPLDSLPQELICRILCFLDPRDLVRLRVVSKLFHGITYDAGIWKAIYANASLPRPPGPFTFQSACFLEQTLRRSERLAECWTTHPIQAVSSVQIRLEGLPLGRPRIIGGKWFLTFESYRQLAFYDIETHSRQILCENTESMTCWDACSLMSTSGFLVYVVFRENTGKGWRAPWKLQEFRVHGDSGHLSHSFSIDVPTKYSGQSVCLVGDKAPFLYIMNQHLVFDTRSRAFYEFPLFGSEVDGIHASPSFMTSRNVLLTNTHIIVASYCPQEPVIPSSTMESTLIQAFTLPTAPHPAGNETGILRLSHEGIIPVRLENIVLVRNSIVDAMTESTCLRFLQLQHEGDRLHFSSVDLTLPRSLSDVVLPMSIEVNDIFAVEAVVHDPIMSPYGYYVEASDDGHMRGFCRNRAGNHIPWITKFTVDATGDKCVATVGTASPPRWIDNNDPPCFSMLSFDGVIGRFCYTKGGQDWRCVDVVIVDIK